MLDRIKKFKKIDAHSHVGWFGGWSNVGITPEEMIAQMDEYNIEKTVISTYPIQESLDAVDKYPDRLIGAAWVNPNEPGCLDQVRNAVEDHGFRAIKLHPLFHSYLPNDESVFPIARLAKEYDIPLMFHAGHPPFSFLGVLPNWQISSRHQHGHDSHGSRQRHVCASGFGYGEEVP